MFKRAIVIRDIDQGQAEKESRKIIRIDLNYKIGGMNYFTGECLERGYYLSVQPMNVGDRFESMMAFSGRTMCVKKASRFSQKTMESIAKEYKDNYDEKVKPYVDQFMAEKS